MPGFKTGTDFFGTGTGKWGLNDTPGANNYQPYALPGTTGQFDWGNAPENFQVFGNGAFTKQNNWAFNPEDYNPTMDVGYAIPGEPQGADFSMQFNPEGGYYGLPTGQQYADMNNMGSSDNFDIRDVLNNMKMQDSIDWSTAPEQIAGQGGKQFYKGQYGPDNAQGYGINDPNSQQYGYARTGNYVDPNASIITPGTDPIETPVEEPIEIPKEEDPTIEPLFPELPGAEPVELPPYETYHPESFQYGSEYQDVMKSIQGFDPNFDASVDPVQWTPEQIQNMYSTQFSDLDRAQQMATSDISNQMQERFQGRSGQLLTRLGESAYDYNRQRENVMSDVLGQILPQQEQLTQGRQALSQQEEALRQSGYRTGSDLLRSVADTDVAKNQQDVTNIMSAVTRTSQSINDALSVGNFKEAAKVSQQQMELEKAKYNLGAEGQEFNQNLSQQALLSNVMGTLLNYNQGEVGDSTNRWQSYLNALLQSSGV